MIQSDDIEHFWTLCSGAIEARRIGQEAAAQRLLVQAGLLTDPPTLPPAQRERRRAHLALIEGALASTRTETALPTGREGSPADGGEIVKLRSQLRQMQRNQEELRLRLQTRPSIDPLCLLDPAAAAPPEPADPFGILLFGHTRLDELEAVLESLKRQDALKYTEVWLDGHQGKSTLKEKIKQTIALVERYQVKRLQTQNGNFAFRKMMLLGLSEMSGRYRDILVLEDDCFPTRDAVSIFRSELDCIRGDPHIFSVYGHPFLVDSEGETCTRFQGWGWATTSRKLRPVLRQLMDCYAMTEERFLQFVRTALTADVRARIDVTPPRQPTHTLEKFFAWDETLCLLTAMAGQVHRPTAKRTIYNCGMGHDSTHFGVNERFRKPPFNLITPDEVWQHF
jgi:hypothetical protein